MMNTQSLIDMLASQAGPAPKRLVFEAFSWPIAIGFVVSLLLAVGLIGFLPMEGLLAHATWIKMVYGLALIAALTPLAAQACKPAASTRGPWLGTFFVIILMVGVGLAFLAQTPSSQRVEALFGQTWLACPWVVMGISLPALIFLQIRARRLAPVNLKAVGFELGLLAGALGALAYSFVCPEQSLAFVAVWYTVGIALTGLLGMLLGPRTLRW
jgi:hypothetical protein